ncbi:MAG: CoA transferase [Pseudomonadales bacterium]|nr:CoA transferase [Pseudomonadales bacterium]
MPLHGIKVVELGSLIAGPFAARLLAEFGADVIKVESPDGGDPLRRWRKLYEGTSLWWYVQSRNKRSLTLNLKTEAGLGILKRLLSQADILIENFRPGVLERLGLDAATLMSVNPGLIIVRLSGFGQTGPMAEQPGFGAIGESMGGLRYVTGFEDRPPVRTGISIGDSIAALFGVMGTMMALRHREVQGGAGQVVDVALYEAVFSMMESLVPEFDVFGFIRERSGNIMPGITPSSTHTSRDGHAIQIAANGDAIFSRLCRLMQRDDWLNHTELADNAGRDRHRNDIYNAMDAWVAQQDIEPLLHSLQAADIPASRIYSVADMFHDPQFLFRDMLIKSSLPDGHPVMVPGIVPKLSATPGAQHWLGPALGEHNHAILSELGLSSLDIEQLKVQGVI